LVVPRGVVVVELHDVGHQRARHGVHLRAAVDDLLDAPEPPDGGRDTAGFRGAGAALRRLLRGDTGRTSRVLDVHRVGEGNGRARARRAHPDLVRGGRRAVDLRRPGGGAGAGGPVAGRARAGLRGAAPRLPGAGAPAAGGVRVERGHGALRRALPALHHHRARGDDSHHRGDHRRPRPRRGGAGGVRDGLRDDGGDVVAVLHLRRQDRAAAAGALREPHRARARRLHLPPRRHGRRHNRLRRRGRARDSPPRRGPAGRGDRRRRGRPRTLPPRPRPLPPQDDGQVGPEAPLRGRGVPRGRRRRALRSGARAGGARHSGAGGGDRLRAPRRRPPRPPRRTHAPRTPRSAGGGGGPHPL
ncbi:MAG: low temperature requirement A, partial [uncultured Rubrobacteraceae bacterium]